MKKTIIFLALVLGISVTAKAQGIQLVLAPGQPFTITLDHDGKDGVGGLATFMMYCDGTSIKSWSPAEVAAGKSALVTPAGLFTYTLTAPGINTVGQHTCQATAVGPNIESPKSNNVTALIGNAIGTPMNFTIIIKVSGGGK